MTKQTRKPYGENMIKVGIKFWTNNLPEGVDEKTAWKSGTIYLYKNSSKSIKPRLVRFSDINGDFQQKLFELLKEQGIKLIEVPKEKFKVVNQ